jgi:hypothetical protein
MPAHEFDPLEPRRLLAWGTYPTLIHQDLAVQNYPQLNGGGRLIVVIDSGVNANHPALASHLWKNPGEIPGDGKDNDNNGYVDDVTGYDFLRNDPTPDDENGHGTATNGILAASPFTYNSATYQGVAQGAKIINLKVLDQTGASNPGAELRIEKALQWVEAMNRRYPITAINMSLWTPDNLFGVYADEFKRLYAAGVIISASGGQDDPNHDAHYPGRAPEAYAASVSDELDHMSPNVNRGPNLDLLAPGVRIPIPNRKDAGFALASEGSSNSAPFVTATATLIKQAWPTATQAEVLQVMKDSGKPIKDTTTQYTYSGRTYPRIDINAALKLAIARNPVKPLVPQSPFKGTPFVAGQRIEAEDFDNGGEGVSFHDTTVSNLPGNFDRATSVDINTTADSGGGHVVGYAVAGEWLEYTINVATAGSYTFAARVASQGDGGRFHAEVDGANVTGTLAVPNTASWTTYTNVTRTVTLPAGKHVLRIALDANNTIGFTANFNYFSFTAISTPTPPPPPTQPPPTPPPPTPPPVVMPPPAPTSTNISADVGAPKPAGATTVLAFGKDYDLKAGGADVYGTTDQFRFAYRVLAGDFDVVVRLDGLAATDSWAKAGLMARESLAANARNVFAFATPSTNGYRLQTRTATGGSTTLSATGGAVTYPNTWLRLRRVGNTFTAYRGTTGTTWAQYAATTMTLPSNIYVGMAATSHNTTTATAARFRSFKVG